MATVSGVTCNSSYDISMPYYSYTAPSTYCVSWQVGGNSSMH
jgi:hypothetical protein